MRYAVPIGMLGLCLSAAGCGATRAEPPAERDTWAIALGVPEEAMARPEILVGKSLPPVFTVALERSMPTPGWTVAVDAVDIDAAARRIVAQLTESGPSGAVAQVITPLRVPVEVGRLRPGRWLFELRVRRGGTAEHRLAHAFVLEAS